MKYIKYVIAIIFAHREHAIKSVQLMQARNRAFDHYYRRKDLEKMKLIMDGGDQMRLEIKAEWDETKLIIKEMYFPSMDLMEK